MLKVNLKRQSPRVVSGFNFRGQPAQLNPPEHTVAAARSPRLLLASESPSSPTNPHSANLLWNLKNLICQHVSIICSITVRVSGKGQRAPLGLGGGEGREGLDGRRRQLHSDGKTALWLGPHVGWNCPGQPRNQIINSDTRHSVSWLGLAWKFWYGSISNLFLSSQSSEASLICVYVYVKALRHPCYSVVPSLTHARTHTHTSPPTPTFSGLGMGASHRDLLDQLTLLTLKKIALCSSIRPLRASR